MMVTVTKLLIIKHINCVYDMHLKSVSHSVAVSIKDTALQRSFLCNRVYCIHVPGYDPITFSFRSFSF